MVEKGNESRKKIGSFSMSTVRKNMRLIMKCIFGRGRRSGKWVKDLSLDHCDELEQFHCFGVKFNSSFLLQQEKLLVNGSDDSSLYCRNV